MKKTILTILMGLLLAGPLFAWHGSPSSKRRDAWIDEGLARLAQAGFLPSELGDTKHLTNLEVAELTAQASERLMAQTAQPATAGASADKTAPQDLQRLVDEFKGELARMEVDVEAAKATLDGMGSRLASYREKQEELKGKTGTELGLFGRGWMVTERGLGPDSVKPPLYRLACNFTEARFRSVPAPDLLFDFRLRMWFTYGIYFEDPMANRIEVRSLRFENHNKVATLEVGDHFKRYTPLTLYNDDPWHYRLKPTYYRKYYEDIEELTLTNEGPSWHLRGLGLRTREGWPDHPILKAASLDLLAGRIKAAGTQFGNYYAGGQADLSFLKDEFGVAGTGLLMWDDPSTASVAYNPAGRSTWTQQYRILSLTPRLKLELPSEMTLDASFELAASDYQDDSKDPDRTYEDWAARGEASLGSHGVKLQGKMLNVGPYFYSPGAQTLRRTPSQNTLGYITTDEKRDFGMIGSRDRNVFQNVGKPFFAPYDRRQDNILPYGDATPNREGFIGGLSAELGLKGWLKPGLFFTKLKEQEPNIVLLPGITPAPNVLKAVDTGEDPAAARTRSFDGLEGMIQLDVARALGRKDMLALGFDVRDQKTALSILPEDLSFKTDTWMATVDFVLPLRWMRWAEMSFLYGRSKAAGKEYVDNEGLASYQFYLWDSPTLDKYTLVEFDEVTAFWAYNVRYAVGKDSALTSSIFQERTERDRDADFDTRRLEWRIGYEFSI